jgi:hypothetical protein
MKMVAKRRPMAKTTTQPTSRICNGCGGEIPPTAHKLARYCSKSCRQTVANCRYLEKPGRREASRTRALEYYSRNREKCLEAVRGYYTENRNAVRARTADYRRSNRGRLATKERCRYHLKTYGQILETSEDIIAHAKDRYRHARALGYRSGLEVAIARFFESLEVPAQYEAYKLKYEVPARIATYTPDFVLPNGITIESKGLMPTAERQKYLLIRNDHPGLDLRFVFTNPNTRISKTSATTYAKWATHHGFLFAKGLPPTEWINEPPEPKRVAAAARAFGISTTEKEN